ncbi:MAG: TetR/AcrR family transcriptional regulator [Rhizobiaceae bacterium]
MALDRSEMNERVLDIAEALLNEGGASNLKARSIAEKAGIAVGSIYNLFGDLDQVHGLVNMRMLDELSAAGNTAVRDLKEMGVSDTRLKLLALSKAYLTFVHAHAASWAAMMSFSPRRMAPEHVSAYEQRLDALFDIIALVLEEDPELGLDHHRCRVTARVLWSSVHGIVMGNAGRHQQKRPGEGVWEQIDLLVTTFLRGLERQVPAPSLQ